MTKTIHPNYIPDHQPIYTLLTDFFQSYLTDRDLEKTLLYVTDDIYSIGSGNHEIAVNKTELYALIQTEFQTHPEPLLYEIHDFICKQTGTQTWNFFCQVSVVFPVENVYDVCYQTRLSGTVVKIEQKLLISCLHMSEASCHQQNNEFFPLHFMSQTYNNLDNDSQQELREIICQVMPGGIIGGYMEPDFPLYLINDELLSMLDFTYDEFIDITKGLVINMIHEDDRKFVNNEVEKQLSYGKQYEIEYRAYKKDGSYLWVYDIGREIVTPDNRKAIISVLVDISENIKQRHYLTEETLRDPLTDIYNRKGGETLIAEHLFDQIPYTYIMADLDNFKSINDFYGHYFGDEVLKYFSHLLKETFRFSDVVFRMGGDEFGIFLPHCSNQQAISEKLNLIIKKYCNKIAKDYPRSNSSVSFGCVIGKNKISFTELYQITDKILYKTKRSGTGYQIRELS